MPPLPAVPNCATRWSIQAVTNEGPMAIEVSSGLFPVTNAPPGRMPFPASGWHQKAQPVAVHSVSVWAP